MILVNYILNKFCPYVAIIFSMSTCLPYNSWQLYVISSMILFIDRFSFNAGYSLAYCHSNNIDLSKK